MKFLKLLVLLVAVTSSAAAQKSVRVRGYTKKSGMYVAPHHQTSPDRSRYNNWSTKGNINPYTGKKGTKSPVKKVRIR